MTGHRNSRWLGVAFLCAALLGAPSQAQANSGTPVMWAGALHLSFGNLLIGIFEGWLLAFIFSLKKWRTIGILIVANYCSACGGFYLLGLVTQDDSHIDITNVRGWICMLVIGAYLLTLLIEWPFVAICFKWQKKPLWIRSSLIGNLIIQTSSYILLFGWYWSVSGASMVTRARVVPMEQVKLPPSGIMYFISNADGDVYSCRFSDRQVTKEFSLHSRSRNDFLFVKKRDDISGLKDLVAGIREGNSDDPEIVVIRRDIRTSAFSEAEERDSLWYRHYWFGYTAIQFERVNTSEWTFQSGYWAVEGLIVENRFSGRRRHYWLETPFLAWPVRNVSHLPTDQALFQLGKDQICIFDPKTEEIALLLHGRNPVVVLEKVESH